MRFQSEMQSDPNRLDKNTSRPSPDTAVWVNICTTLENTVLVLERVTDFVSASRWAPHEATFESRTRAAQARLAHLRASVASREQLRKIGTRKRTRPDSGAAPPGNGHANVASEPLLTAREREVAILIAKGRSNRQIADALVLVTGTVANHVAHILGKLNCANRAQVAAWAVRNGLLNDDSFG